MKTFKEFLNEDAPANSVGAGMQGLSSTQGSSIAGFDKILPGMPIRRNTIGMKIKKLKELMYGKR